jgi:hypothetical protein
MGAPITDRKNSFQRCHWILFSDSLYDAEKITRRLLSQFYSKFQGISWSNMTNDKIHFVTSEEKVALHCSLYTQMNHYTSSSIYSPDTFISLSLSLSSLSLSPYFSPSLSMLYHCTIRY